MQKSQEQKQLERERKQWVEIEEIRSRSRVNRENHKTMAEVTKKDSKFQAKYFINAYFPRLWNAKLQAENPVDELELIFSVYYPKFVELNRAHWKNSNKNPNDFLDTGSLPQDLAFNFVENVWKDMYLGGPGQKPEKFPTALEFKSQFKSIDKNNDGNLAMIEFLLWNYGYDPNDLFARRQVANHPDIEQAQQAVFLVEENIRQWEEKKAQLEDTINNAASTVAKNQAVQNLSNHMDKQDQFNMDLSSAKKQRKTAISKAFKDGDAQGAAWWVAREVTQKEQDGPKKTSKLKKPAGIQG
jgi:hypothetical protein